MRYEPDEVSPAQGIFQYFNKKGKKQLVTVKSELLVKCYRLDLNQTTFPIYRDVLTEVSQVYGTFYVYKQ